MNEQTQTDTDFMEISIDCPDCMCRVVPAEDAADGGRKGYHCPECGESL